MHDLAVFMAEGEGGEQTYAGAVEWFRKALNMALSTASTIWASSMSKALASAQPDRIAVLV